MNYCATCDTLTDECASCDSSHHRTLDSGDCVCDEGYYDDHPNSYICGSKLYL